MADWRTKNDQDCDHVDIAEMRAAAMSAPIYNATGTTELVKLALRLVRMGTLEGADDRRKVTLGELIEQARNALGVK